MKRWANFSILLLQLPLSIRLALLVLAFLLCLTGAVLSMPMTHSADILVIPVAMGAWFFGYRGMLLCTLATILIMTLMGFFIGYVSFLDLSLAIRILTGVIILIAI